MSTPTTPTAAKDSGHGGGDGVTLKIINAKDASGDGASISVTVADGLIQSISRESETAANDNCSSNNDSNSNKAEQVTVLDAEGRSISAGFIDCYARLRDPGFEKKGTIDSEARAAALNGFTTVFCSPDTDPVIDEAATVELIHRKARDTAHAKILPIAALTRGLEGTLLSELATLIAAGCVAASNADRPITDLQVLRSCMDYARTFDIVLVMNPVDYWLAGSGCAHEGATATRLGLPAIPVAAETVALSVMIELAWQTGARIHFSRITSARGAEMIGEAKREGLAISADASINHLIYEDTCLSTFDSQYRSVAPFRDIEDREGLRQAISDGTIDCICTDHAPHEHDAKLAPFPSAEPGISGFDTFLPLLLQLEHDSGIPLRQLLHCVNTAPAGIFGLASGRLETGYPADLVLFDEELEYELGAGKMLSAGHNTPLLGKTLRGKVQRTLVDGRMLAAEFSS